MKICTIGLGYIGLPTSITFAKYGADVVGIDILPHIIDMLNEGNIHIEEPGLEEVLKEVVAKGKFRASLVPEEADAFIIAVPTPNRDDQYKSCDLSYVLDATKKILPYIRKGNVLIVESTIAPRSMDDYVKPLVEAAGFKVGEDIYLVYCPERVLPGQILRELIHNNRIVGGITKECAEAGAQVYSLFVKGEIIRTDAKTAEMAKLMENTFRDVNIALVNELTKVCNELEINVLDAIQMANKHPRVNLHAPGPGVGGHCLAVDPYFIVAKAPEVAKIIYLARKTNLAMPQYVVDSVKKMIGETGKKIAIFGVTYKADVDDIRESPAMEIVRLLESSGFNVVIHDPHVQSNIIKLYEKEEAVNGAALILLLTNHCEFKVYNYEELTSMMETPIIFDTRNCIREESKAYKLINFGNVYNAKNFLV